MKSFHIWLLLITSATLFGFGVMSVFAEDNPQSPPERPFGGGGIENQVQNLSEQGYDVSNIKASLDSGDNETARELLEEFWREHPDARPQRPVMDSNRLKEMVTELAGKGYDVSEILAAIDAGENSTAQTLLDEFWKDNPDARPAPKEGDKKPQ